MLDLFSGAGLFTLPLGDSVGSGQVHAVEGNRRAVANARENVGRRPGVHVHQGDVHKVLSSGRVPERADVIVLDPPRVGARKGVMTEILRRQPQRIVYVSCDPAALARDLSLAAEGGYRAQQVTAYDLFPHTHHIESVAVLSPQG